MSPVLSILLTYPGRPRLGEVVRYMYDVEKLPVFQSAPFQGVLLL